MKLICEQIENVRYVVEAKESGQKNYFIEGIFMQADIQNRNGRMYPGDILEKECQRYMKEAVEQGRAYGELGHPNGPSINLDRVSHLITNLRQEGSNYIGKAKIMETPMGNIVKGLMDGGGSLGVSTRGLGSLAEDKTKGCMVVQDDFRLATAADIVADPSAPDAFVRGIMEGVDWVWDNGLLKAQKLEEIHESIKKAPSKNLSEAKVNAFKSFINELVKG
jgi:hypothetical protein